MTTRSSGRVRAHSLRKFFVTQLTDHGVQDKVINYFLGHAIPEVDSVYWSRRVEELRRVYAENERYLNPVSTKTLAEISSFKEMKRKIKELELRVDNLSREQIKVESVSAFKPIPVFLVGNRNVFRCSKELDFVVTKLN